MKNITVSLSEEEFKEIVVAIIYRQEGVKRLIKRAEDVGGISIHNRIELGELDALFYKLVEQGGDIE